MRNPALLLALAFATAAPLCPMHAQAGGTAMQVLPQAELDVVKVLTNQERAWNKGDLNGFLAGYKRSPDTIFIGATVQHGSDNLAARYHSTYPTRDAMGTLSFSELEPRLLDEQVAIVTGHYHLERPRKGGGNADGIFSLVLQKTDGGWKIVLDHTS